LWLRRTLGEKIADIIIKESAQDSYWNQPSEYLKELVEESLKTRGLWPEEKSALMELFDVTFRHVRVWGEIAAGKPIEFYEREEYVVIALPPDLVGKDLHALKVNGDSMDEEVKDGEIVVCEKTSKATDGDLVVVFVEDEGGSTLKRIYRDNGHVRLEPRNKKHKPKIYDAHKVTIQGVVRLIQRRP
jgi:SOS-response transcriptional repressor LexA